MGGAPMEGQE